jgi:hypothetical protein
MERKEGRGRPGAPNNEEAPKSQSKPNQPEQSPHGGGIKTPERQSLPSAWDLLERKARCSDKFLSGRMTKDEWEHEGREVDQLKKELYKKGTPRDKHILALLFNRAPGLSLLSEREQIQEWRSLVEPLSDDDIAECARKQKKEIEDFRRGEIPILSFHPSAGNGELILADFIKNKKRKEMEEQSG